jgi:hypothetical protein
MTQLTHTELEVETGTVLPERATPFVLSLLHFGANHAVTIASNRAVAVNGGVVSIGNFSSASATQFIQTNQG